MAIEFESVKKNKKLPVIKFLWALFFTALLFSGRIAFSVLIRDQEQLIAVSGVYKFIEGLVAVAALYYTCRHIFLFDRQLAKAWILLTLGFFGAFLGDVIWIAYIQIFNEPPTPSFADLFYILSYVSLWLGLYIYPLGQRRGSEYKYIWLDNIIVILGSGLFFWVLFIEPLSSFSSWNFSQFNFLMVYPSLDLVLVWSLLTFFRNRPDQSNYPPLLLIGFGLFIVFAADWFFSYGELVGTYKNSTINDLAYALGYMVTVLAGFAQVNALMHQPKPSKETSVVANPNQSWPVYLPYFWLIVACMILYINGASPAQEPELYITIGIIIILVVSRQVLTLRDNETLFIKAQLELKERNQAQEALRQAHTSLEERVRQRTADLQNANEELQIQIADRQRAEQALRIRSEMDQMVAFISTQFINTPASEVKSEITRTLAMLGKFAGAVRCYLARYTDDGSAFSITNEWVSEGNQPHMPALQNISSASTPWWTETLHRFEFIHIPDVEQLPAEARIEKAILHEKGIQAVVIVPLVSEHNLVGFLGFDAVRGKNEYLADEVSLLKTIAEILTNAMRRAQLQHELQEHVRKIEKSLDEKNVLLKEIHHRVKNNLQVISSLLSLQSAQIKDPQTVQLFRDSQNRVRSMALIHEKLYRSSDLGRIDFRGYVQSLSNFLVRSFAAEARGVGIRIEIQDITLGIDQAIPCGLIINELVSNALKYAFPNDRTGEIVIQFSREEGRQFHLNVGDNGIGFPENIDYRNTVSLGLQLVNSLVVQLGGTMQLCRSGGTEFQITFYEPEIA